MRSRAVEACAIGKKLNLPDDKIEGIKLGAIIHAIGKISPIEYEMLKTHSQTGYEILRDIKCPWPIANIYPQGLFGDAILLEARIIAVALAHIEEFKGSLYDAQAVDACLELFDEGFSLPTPR
jgi:HD-GYP domain-containing protein (c-di-GMP phosphodiesterase class II)